MELAGQPAATQAADGFGAEEILEQVAGAGEEGAGVGAGDGDRGALDRAVGRHRVVGGSSGGQVRQVRADGGLGVLLEAEGGFQLVGAVGGVFGQHGQFVEVGGEFVRGHRSEIRRQMLDAGWQSRSVWSAAGEGEGTCRFGLRGKHRTNESGVSPVPRQPPHSKRWRAIVGAMQTE